MEKLCRNLEDASSKEKTKLLINKICNSVDYTKSTVGFICLSFTHFTTILPKLDMWPDEFHRFIEKAIFDCDMKADLENSNLINWCRTAQILYPLNTKKDGNCLLHAISLSIWGIHDSELILRRLLHTTLQHDTNDIFKRRYVMFIQDGNKQNMGDLIQFNSTDITNDWNGVVENVKPKLNPSFANPHTFLEPIHIFVMANILKRPIIVIADDTVRTLCNAMSLQENDIGGIYLPLEVPAGRCCKSPVIIGFSYNHFCPLISCKEFSTSNRKAAIPLQKKDMTQLPLKFLYQHEEKHISTLSSDYLNLMDLVYSDGGSIFPISGAKLGKDELSESLNVIPDYFKDCEKKYRSFLDTEAQGPIGAPIPQAPVSPHHTPVPTMYQRTTIPNTNPNQTQERYFGIRNETPSPETMHYFQNRKCITVGCSMFGTAATGNMCSGCLKKYTEEHTGPLVVNSEPTAPPPSFPLQESTNTLSFIETKCQEPGCTYYCSIVTYPWCHECKAKKQAPMIPSPNYASETRERERLSAELETTLEAPFAFPTPSSSSNLSSESELYGIGSGIGRGTHQRNLTGSSVAHVALLVCPTSGCKNPGMADHGGMCMKCYVESGRIPVAASQVGIKTRVNQPRDNNRNMFGLEESAGASWESVELKSAKHLCSTPGCLGIRQRNEHNMCLLCFEKNKVTTHPSAIQEMGINTGNIEENIIESATPSNAIIEPRQVSCMDEDSAECASPLCNRSVFPPNKLCESCLNVLRQNQPASKSSKSNALCKTTGCNFHGYTKFNGLCSECYRKLQDRGQYQTNSEPVSKKNCYPVEAPLIVRSNTAPITRKGNQCIVESCTRFGDPSTNSMCSRCFSINNRTSSAGIINHEPRIPIQEESLPRAGSNLSSTQDLNFLRNIQRLEESMKQNTICRKSDCQNYGHSSTEGFCNSCYKKFYQGQFTNPRPFVGEERNG